MSGIVLATTEKMESKISTVLKLVQFSSPIA